MTESLTVRDNRTGAEYEIPIVDGTIKAADLGQIKLNDDEPGLATYDPGFVNTASCRSAMMRSMRALLSCVPACGPWSEARVLYAV